MAEYMAERLDYKIKCLLETGEILDLTGLCLSLDWGDQKASIAAKAGIVLANTKTEKGYISDMVKLCTRVFIYANGKEVFRGTVWEWNYSSAIEKEISLTAYDNMIYLTQSKSNNYFSSGMDTQAIIESICTEWGIPLKYQWVSWSHGKLPLVNKTIADMITSTLDEAQTKLDSKYVAFMSNDTLEIKERGSNLNVFYFHTGNIMSTKDSLSLQGLVTKVLIVGKSEDNARPPLIETLDGKVEYGVLQEIVTKDTNKSLADAKKEAENILAEKGKPDESITVLAADVPVIRKGDKVKIIAGNLSGYFFVAGITHNATDRRMDMELMQE